MRARRRRSIATSSPAATASTASAGRAFPTACSACSSATIRSAGSAFSSESPPPDHELIYSYTDRGFALYTMRSMSLARLYLQCDHDEDIENWPDARIWDELHKRLGGARKLAEGKIAAKGHHADAQLRGRADAARPPVPRRRQRAYRAADRRQGHEPRLRRRGGVCRARSRRSTRASATIGLENYSADLSAARLVRAALLLVDDADPAPLPATRSAFDRRRQLSDLDYITRSEAASTMLAEQYVGLPLA